MYLLGICFFSVFVVVFCIPSCGLFFLLHVYLDSSEQKAIRRNACEKFTPVFVLTWVNILRIVFSFKNGGTSVLCDTYHFKPNKYIQQYVQLVVQNIWQMIFSQTGILVKGCYICNCLKRKALNVYTLDIFIVKTFLRILNTPFIFHAPVFPMFFTVVFRPTREFFTQMETSPFPMKGCKFWPMLGTRVHWAVRVLYRALLKG